MSEEIVIGIAGLSCEISTFTPGRTKLEDFYPLRGDAILEQYAFLRSGSSLGDAATWSGALTASAIPGPIVTKEAFEELAGEIVERLETLVNRQPLDGLWFDIHGAMSVEGLDDTEAELLRRIRKVVGWDTAVTTSMDLHGNVSCELVQQTDLITCYRTAPHEDVMETKERACRHLVELIVERRDHAKRSGYIPEWPVKAYIPIPVLLPGEKTSTRMEPAKSIYATVRRFATAAIIDASLWVGYAWADEPRSHASVVATDWNEGIACRTAERLAEMFWEAREGFKFAAPAASLDTCLGTALESSARPYFISDSGDNPTAGGSGDVTWTLKHILACPDFQNAKGYPGSKVIYASLPAPSAVATAVDAGLGNNVTVTLGAEGRGTYYRPITMRGSVYAIKHEDSWAETEVVLRITLLNDTSIFVILTKKRKPYHLAKDFTNLDLDITKDGRYCGCKDRVPGA